MAKIHTLTYNGTKSSDLGVFVTGSGSFDAAEIDVDKYEIPGRNGNIILPNHRYKNIEITYPAFIPKAFMDKAQNVRNWLRSSKVYARLEDTYDMDHYRLGIPTGVQSFSPENRNDGANFEMTFDCKPQRFLKVGETPETVEADVQTESGEIVTFETVAESPITSAEVSLSPRQELNGYDSPWPAGGGKNLLKTNDFSDYTNNGVTWHRNDDGSVVLNGTATARSYKYLNGGYYLKLEPGAYTASASGFESGGAFGNLSYGNKENGLYAGSFGKLDGTIPKRTFTVENTIYLGVFVDVPSGTTNSNRLIKIQIEEGSTATEWSPYSNICPISGHTVAELNIAKHNIWDEEWTNGSIGVETGAVAGGSNVISQNYISVVPNTEYYATQRIRVFFYDANKTFLSFVDIDHRSFTTPSECRYILFTAFLVYGTTYNNDISINYPATDTEYHAYDDNTYSVTFTDQGTVYGGTYDFVSGKLEVQWANIASYNGETITEPWLSSMDVYSAGATPTTGAQVVYKLATPIEYTLSPQQLTTLLGQNNVWGSGPITLTYAEPYNIENPTLFDARPLFTVTNPAEGDVIMVNGQAITFVDGYSGTVFIDCETMNALSGAANLNSIIQATDFPVLVPGTNIITWTGAGECTMTPRWWEL